MFMCCIENLFTKNSYSSTDICNACLNDIIYFYKGFSENSYSNKADGNEIVKNGEFSIQISHGLNQV